MGSIYWGCICNKYWGLKNDVCSKCGRSRDKIRDIDYLIEYRLVNGKKKRELAKDLTFRQAQDLLHKRENEISEGRFFPLRGAGSRTLQELIDRWLEKIKIESAEGGYGRAKLVTTRMTKFLGNPPASLLTAENIEDWKLYLRREHNLSEGSVNLYLALGKALWNYTLPDLTNPWSKVKFYKLKPRIADLTIEEETRVLEEAYKHCQQTGCPDFFEILVIAIATGLRRSNVLRLQRSEVNFDTGYITVTVKGNKTHSVFMSDVAREILQDVPPNGTPYYWVSTRRGRGYMKPHVDYTLSLKSCLRRAGVDYEKFHRWHDLRHHAASKMVPLVGIRGTKEFLGHATIEMTMRYAHYEKGLLEQGINKAKIQLPNRENVIEFPKRAAEK